MPLETEPRCGKAEGKRGKRGEEDSTELNSCGRGCDSGTRPVLPAGCHTAHGVCSQGCGSLGRKELMRGKVGQHLLEPRALSWSVQSTQRAQKWGRTHRGGSRPAAHPRRSRFQEGPAKGLHILTRPCEEEKPSPRAARTCPWEGAPTGLSWSPGPWPLSPGSMLEPGLVSCPLLPDLPSLFPTILLFLLLLSEGRDKHSPISMLTEEVTLSIFLGPFWLLLRFSGHGHLQILDAPFHMGKPQKPLKDLSQRHLSHCSAERRLLCRVISLFYSASDSRTESHTVTF